MENYMSNDLLYSFHSKKYFHTLLSYNFLKGLPTLHVNNRMELPTLHVNNRI